MRWLRPAFLMAALAGGGWAVARRWDELTAALSELAWPAVAGAFIAALAASFVSMLVWRALLSDFGSPLPVSAASYVYFLGQLGKYVPGSVWSVLAQMERRRSAAVGLIGVALAVICGLILAAAVLPASSPEALRRYWPALLVVPLLVLALHPRVLGTSFDLLLRVLRREPLGQSLSPRGALRAAAWQLLGWLLFGMHAYVLVLGFGADPGRSLPVALGGFALAFCLGVLFLPAPAGAGVREAALVLALSPVLAVGPALAVALVSRVLLTAADFALASAPLLRSRVHGPLPRVNPPSPAPRTTGREP
jgi:glycosyltransferase 2 family protein